jgi:membrane fusion protein, heavy metal efflux system
MRLFKTKTLFFITFLAACGSMLFSISACADSGTVRSRALVFTSRLEAYARVEPIAILRLKAALTGVVSGLRVLPGETVRAGFIIARLEGPEIENLLTGLRSAVDGAEAAETAARKSLAIERRKEAQRLSTKKEVYLAEADLAEKRALLENVRSRLRAMQNQIILKSPVTASILTIELAEGELAQKGQTILTMQPSRVLWLKGLVYGSEASSVHVGMKGVFSPTDGSTAIPVMVRTIIGAVQPDGALSIGMVAMVPAPVWRNGETGTVMLEGPKQTLTAVPTRSLILDRGRWWVLVHTSRGNRRQEVIPGPSRGDSTLIEHGLKPDIEVVVENAYLEFHREFSKHYQPPD